MMRVSTTDDAVAEIGDGAVILVGGFAGAGSPGNLIDALARRGIGDLTIVVNAILPGDAIDQLFDDDRVRQLICTFPVSSRVREMTAAERRIRDGSVHLDLVPQGTFTERIRCGGAGIPAFYTPVGVGTVVADGKDQRLFDDRPCLLETAIRADVALLRADRADPFGNLCYRGAGRNFNPVMATAADLVIAEVDECVDAAFDPEQVVTPGLFVDRVVMVPRRSERNR